jgi:hypothetical protein
MLLITRREAFKFLVQCEAQTHSRLSKTRVTNQEGAMKTLRTLLALLALLASLTPLRVAAQESPGSITAAEHQCQNAFGKALVDFGAGTAACLQQCETNPGRRCDPFFPDTITGDCLSRVRASAQGRVLRQCAGTDCPECYGGGLDCASYANSAFSQAASTTQQAIGLLYCNDSSSPDGLTRAEQRCQEGLVRDSGHFVEKLQGCFASCAQAVQRGATGFSSCEAAFLDTPTFDPKTQRCVDKARARLLSSCGEHCTDPPDCFPYSCSETAQLIEQQALAADPTTYCADTVCGDGKITGNEACDPAASPNGCPIGEFCNGCQSCYAPCFDGILSPDELCDPTASPTGCPSGETCLDCVECVPTPVCGDGQVTFPEVCDPSATPNGCPPGFTCTEDCQFCQLQCGNGVVDPGEVCDPANTASCGPGTTCTTTCDACIPFVSATEDLTPCEPPVFDQWSFQVTAGQTVLVHADTTDAQTAADLCFVGSCTDGQSFAGDDDVACSFPPPAFACPETTFTAIADSTCTVDVQTCSPTCSDPFTADYRLDVTGTDLTLVLDDVSPSAGGAFVRGPAGKVK